MKRKLIAFIIIIVLVIAGLAVVKHKKAEIASLPKPAPQPMAVETSVASKGSLEILSHQMGEIQSYTSADLSPRITGHILSISKREGDSVEKGEIVCVVDDRELADRAASSRTEASATRERLLGAKSLYETQASITDRDEKLFAAGAISKEALERSRAALESAKAAVDAYEENIKGLEKNADAAMLQTGYARLKAPFSGVVTKRLAEPGDLAVPGKPVLVIEQKSPLKVTAQVPQEIIKKLGSGGKIYLTDGTARMSANIAKVYPALGKNFMGYIEMIFDQSPFGLPSGSTIGVDIVTAETNGIIVPENAIVHTSKGYFIYLVENSGTIKIRQVEFLGSEGGMTSIKGDVPEGSTVAVAQENRLLTLTEGMKVSTGTKL
jgi:RND family efflux transporter MFP subunit